MRKDNASSPPLFAKELRNKSELSLNSGCAMFRETRLQLFPIDDMYHRKTNYVLVIFMKMNVAFKTMCSIALILKFHLILYLLQSMVKWKNSNCIL